MDIALATDAGYLPWAATAVMSCMRTHPRGAVRFHIFAVGDVDTTDQERLAAMVGTGGAELDIRCVDPSALAGLPTVGRLSRAAWVRLLLPELLTGVPRVLYLDADTLVVGDLTPLWSTALGDAPLAAVGNVVAPDLRRYIASLGIHDHTQFFNSGVLLMDLDRMRDERATDALLSTAHRLDGQLVWADQEVLNVVFAKRWLRLHPRWNAQHAFWMWRAWAAESLGETAVNEAMAAPVILHFEGDDEWKPWHFMCPHPWRPTYVRTLLMTPWADTPLQDRTPGTRLIRRLPRRLRLPAYRRLRRLRRWTAHASA